MNKIILLVIAISLLFVRCSNNKEIDVSFLDSTYYWKLESKSNNWEIKMKRDTSCFIKQSIFIDSIKQFIFVGDYKGSVLKIDAKTGDIIQKEKLLQIFFDTNFIQISKENDTTYKLETSKEIIIFDLNLKIIERKKAPYSLS